MSNINFNNPYLLLIAIPLLAIAIIPFFIAVRKTNANIHNKLAFVCNLLICVLVSLVAGNMTYERVITETHIYVLADVSYSSNENISLVAERVNDVIANAPKNSKVGIIAFAKDYEVINKPSEELPANILESLSASHVDRSETNIASAMQYAGEIFETGVIKRIVLISDGNETNSSNIVSVVNNLSNNEVYIDAIYIDDNIKKETKEIQINQVEYTNSCYLNANVNVDVLIQSNNEEKTNATVSLISSEYNKDKAVELSKGYNVVSFSLPTDVAGEFDYEIKVTPRFATDDTSKENNNYLFSFKVSDKLKVLALSEEAKDEDIIRSIYGDMCEITYFYNDFLNLPTSVYELCDYDEFVLSNVDVSHVNDYTSFLSSLDILVSEYGKSVVTFGNTYIQTESDNDALAKLNGMLPTKYGKQENDRRLVTIVIDISYSMMQISHMAMAKSAACQLLDLLEDDDYVAVVGFSGDITTVQTPTEVANKEEVKKKINNLQPGQGTYMGLAMNHAYSLIKNLDFSKKEVFIISDGQPYVVGDDDPNNPRNVAKTMAGADIVISTLNTQCDSGAKLMSDMATIGKGNYYYAKDEKDVNNLFLTDIADDVKEIKVEGGHYNVVINHQADNLVNEIEELSEVNGFYYNKAKANAETVLTIEYVKDTSVPEEDQIIKNVPLYTYWNYGTGRVASFASTLSSYWTKANFYSLSDSATDQAKAGLQVLKNILTTNVPEIRVDSPIAVEINQEGTTYTINTKTPSVDYTATVTIEVTDPSGKVSTYDTIFDSEKYILELNLSETGRYALDVIYNVGTKQYHTVKLFENSYLPEYDSFESYDVANLYYMVSGNGKVFTDGNLSLVNDESNVITYTYDFTFIFMIIAAGLFVASIIIRKIRWADIKGLFVKVNK